jgi:hypothetical protein
VKAAVNLLLSSAHMSDSGINKVYSNRLMPRFASRAAYNIHVLDFLHGFMITQQQSDRVSNPLRSNAWTLLCRRNESKSPIEPLFNRRLVNCSAHIFDFLHGFIRRSNKATAYCISSGFILRILIASMLHGLHVVQAPLRTGLAHDHQVFQLIPLLFVPAQASAVSNGVP